MADSLLPSERRAILAWLQKMRDVYTGSHPNVAEWAIKRMDELQDEALRQRRETDQLEEDMYGSGEPLGAEAAPPLAIDYTPPDSVDDELGRMLEGDEGETGA